MSLLQRVRETGRYPPSLLSDDRNVGDVGFDALISRILDPTVPNSISLGFDSQVPDDFLKVLKMCESVGSIPGGLDRLKKVAALEQRRCVVLAIIASTPSKNDSLKRILARGLLTSLKPWLDDILTSVVGGVDLLLHFLSSIAGLPVTKSHVRDSGMGKKVGSIEKHRICAGTLNENAIKMRIQSVKDSWNASVKALKDHQSSSSSESRKRTLVDSSQSKQKKIKIDDPKASFSSLVKKVSGKTEIKTDSQSKTKKTNKSSKRVKWSDHFGGKLKQTREIEGNRGEQPINNGDDQEVGNVSWSDRRKRDRLREKELVAQAKKKKLLDDDDDILTASLSTKPTVAWRKPPVTPERSDITKAQVDSKELTAQQQRMVLIPPSRYAAENLVPNNPTPMTDVEIQLDVQSAQSSTPMIIPFFVTQEVPPPISAPAPAAYPVPIPPAPAPAPYASIPPPPPPPSNSSGATAEMVQGMGLPLFLVGSNIQALQTIASNPSLLSTFVDANGMYDQQNLLALVQTLGQNMPNQPQPQSQPPQPQQQQQVPPPTYANPYAQQPQQNFAATHISPYGPAATPAPSPYGQSSHYGPSSTTAVRSTYRGDQNTTEANLHMAGYGPTATQTEIVALFSPYVRVKEVVMKNGFCFVNTSDPVGAKNAKDALNGAIVGGMPVRINMAQRRNRENGSTNSSATNTSTMSSTTAYSGSQSASHSSIRNDTSLPRNPVGQVDYDSVRDDRGNPATKNLFVAGYGPGTTEQELRSIFNQHATITGCVVKGNFSFVNTTDRNAAVIAREALTGAVINGGVLRINFAKETGRLGTSFDLTYGPNTGGQSSGSRSYYGR